MSLQQDLEHVVVNGDKLLDEAVSAMYNVGDFMHSLRAENTELKQQLREKDQEIERLRMLLNVVGGLDGDNWLNDPVPPPPPMRYIEEEEKLAVSPISSSESLDPLPPLSPLLPPANTPPSTDPCNGQQHCSKSASKSVDAEQPTVNAAPSADATSTEPCNGQQHCSTSASKLVEPMPPTANAGPSADATSIEPCNGQQQCSKSSDISQDPQPPQEALPPTCNEAQSAVATFTPGLPKQHPVEEHKGQSPPIRPEVAPLDEKEDDDDQQRPPPSEPLHLRMTAVRNAAVQFRRKVNRIFDGKCDNELLSEQVVDQECDSTSSESESESAFDDVATTRGGPQEEATNVENVHKTRCGSSLPRNTNLVHLQFVYLFNSDSVETSQTDGGLGDESKENVDDALRAVSSATNDDNEDEVEPAKCTICQEFNFTPLAVCESLDIPFKCTSCLVQFGFALKCARVCCQQLWSREWEHQNGLEREDGLFWLCLPCSLRQDLVFIETRFMIPFMPFMPTGSMLPAVALTKGEFERIKDYMKRDSLKLHGASQLVPTRAGICQLVGHRQLDFETPQQRFPCFGDKELIRLCFNKVSGYCPPRIQRLIEKWKDCNSTATSIEAMSQRFPNWPRHIMLKRENRLNQVLRIRATLEKELKAVLMRWFPDEEEH